MADRTVVMGTTKEVTSGSAGLLLIRRLRESINVLEFMGASLSLLEKGVTNTKRGKG